MSENILRSKILVIESKPEAAHVIQTALTDSNTDPFDVEWVGQLSEGLVRLSTKGIAAVLLNLSLPDSYGIETLEKLLRVVPDVPVLCWEHVAVPSPKFSTLLTAPRGRLRKTPWSSPSSKINP